MVGVTRFTLRGIAGSLVTVVAVLVLAAFVVQAVPAVVGADASYVVLSGSMEPTISTGDAVIVKSVDTADIESGDVITFTRGDSDTPVTHRVIGTVQRDTGTAFRTKGDANGEADPAPVPAQNVTGEVWVVIPYIGHVVLFANTPTGLGVLVGLPVAAFILSELYAYATGEGESDGDLPDTTAATASGPATVEASNGAVDESADDTDAGTITVTTTDLRFTSVGFAALAAHSGYIAYQTLDPVHVSVFAGAAMVVLFVGTMLVFGEVTSEEETAERADANRQPRVQESVAAARAPRFPFEDRNETVADGGRAEPTDGGEDDGA